MHIIQGTHRLILLSNQFSAIQGQLYTSNMARNTIDSTTDSMQAEQYKVVVIGNPGVGKTALTFRFCDGVYRDNLGVTIGVDLRVKNVNVDNEVIKLNIWDTAGFERNRQTLNSHYYRNLHAVILVYDVTKQETFDNLAHWLEEVQMHSSEDVIKILIGNKCDEKAVVDRQTAQQFADTYGMPLFETSAKLDTETENIEGIFLTIAHKLKANANLLVNKKGISLRDGDNTPQDSGCSC